MENFTVLTTVIFSALPLLCLPLLPIKLLKTVVLQVECVSESHKSPAPSYFTKPGLCIFITSLVTLLHTDFGELLP